MFACTFTPQVHAAPNNIWQHFVDLHASCSSYKWKKRISLIRPIIRSDMLRVCHQFMNSFQIVGFFYVYRYVYIMFLIHSCCIESCVHHRFLSNSFHIVHSFIHSFIHILHLLIHSHFAFIHSFIHIFTFIHSYSAFKKFLMMHSFFPRSAFIHSTCCFPHSAYIVPPKKKKKKKKKKHSSTSHYAFIYYRSFILAFNVMQSHISCKNVISIFCLSGSFMLLFLITSSHHHPNNPEHWTDLYRTYAFWLRALIALSHRMLIIKYTSNEKNYKN